VGIEPEWLDRAGRSFCDLGGERIALVDGHDFVDGCGVRAVFSLLIIPWHSATANTVMGTGNC
jgi:hypothetical protein